jgi:ribosomal protein S12 methylthiotransferase accessory factor YcaO
VAITDGQRQATADDVRRERGLYDPEDARRWMADNDLTRQQCALLMGQEAQVRWAQSISSLPVADRMPDQLRVDGDYPELVARARHKGRALEAAGYRDVSLADLGVEWDDVLAWYFHQRLGTAVPADVAAFATAHGFSDQAHFRRVLGREYAYATGLAAGARQGAATQPSAAG